MNIYLISAKMAGYDVFDSAVVVAATAARARKIHPRTGEKFPVMHIPIIYNNTDWVNNPKDVKCELIGRTRRYKRERVILASFNAG